MTDQYNIYLVNKADEEKTFWCFLERPKEVLDDTGVFANSSAYVSVDPSDPGTSMFEIPVQFLVSASSSTTPFKSGQTVQVETKSTLDVDLKDNCSIQYSDTKRLSPKLSIVGQTSPDDTITITTQDFDKVQAQRTQGWYSTQTFGINTAQGFIGMTWSPEPGEDKTLTPTLKFYVSTGEHGNNTLADWTTVSHEALVLSVPDSFDTDTLSVTVELGGDGKWTPKPGAPAP